MCEDRDYPVHITDLPRRCTLLLYTDVLVERPGAGGTEAVDELSERPAWRAGGPRRRHRPARRPVAARPQHDDVAVPLLRRTPT
jgi:hypothetical protein